MRILIEEKLLEDVIGVMRIYWFSEDGEYNNDDIMDVTKELEEAIKIYKEQSQ